MTRFASSSMQALSEQSLTAFRTLVKMGVTSGHLHFCSGRQFLYFDSATYVPTHGLGSIEAIEEETDVFPRDVTLRLCGVNTLVANSSLSLYEPLRESMYNREVSIYHAFVDPANNFTMANTPELRWVGSIQHIKIDIEAGEYELRAVSESRRSAKVQYFNRETFRAVDSSDTFCDWMDSIPLYKSQWGTGGTVDFAGTIAPTFIEQFNINRIRAKFGG